MRKILTAGVVLLMLLIQTVWANYEDELLKKADEAFFPVDVGYFKVFMEDYEDNKYRRYYRVEIFTRDDKYLLVGLEPNLIRGFVQLRVGDIIYSYIRRIDRMEQLSAKVAFQGSTLSQEDIMNTSLAKLYNLQSYEEGLLDGKKVYILHLTARTKEVAYHRIVSYIDVESHELIKRDYFTFSGDKVREMIVNEIRKENGEHKAVGFTFYDTLRPGYYTKVKIDDFSYHIEAPETYFTRSYMKAVAK